MVRMEEYAPVHRLPGKMLAAMQIALVGEGHEGQRRRAGDAQLQTMAGGSLAKPLAE